MGAWFAALTLARIALVDDQAQVVRSAWSLDSALVRSTLPFLGPQGDISWQAPMIGSGQGSSDVCIESDYGQADLYVDGAFVGSPPSLLKLPVGEHLIEARVSGQQEWQRRITIVGGGRVLLHAFSGARIMGSVRTCGAS